MAEKRVLFWDKDNSPIHDTLEWARKFEDDDYRTIAVDVDDINDMHKMVSTIWRGIPSPPYLFADQDNAMIFETAYLFDGDIVDLYPSHSLEGALAMHNMVCQEFLGKDAAPEEGHRETIVKMRRRE